MKESQNTNDGQQERFFNAEAFRTQDLHERNPLAYICDELDRSEADTLTLDPGAVLSVVGAFQQHSSEHRTNTVGTIRLDNLRGNCFKGIDNGHMVQVERTDLLRAVLFLAEELQQD